MPYCQNSRTGRLEKKNCRYRSDVRDESNREGVRVVIEGERDPAAKNVILSQLYKLTPLQTSYGINRYCTGKRVAPKHSI
jgi:DNA gyrase/topoisomerase IV subunit A